MDYYLTFTETHFTLSEPDPGDIEWGSTGEYGVNVHPVALYASERQPRTKAKRHNVLGSYEKLFQVTAAFGYDAITPGEFAYVVFVEYSDGDTFGHSGYWNVPAIRKDQEAAEDVVSQIESGVRPSTLVGYLPWEGYFAHVENVWVEEMFVRS